MDNYSFLGAANTAFFEEIYEQYLKEPDSVESSWRSFFQGYDFANESYSEEELEAQLPDSFKKEFKVINLINAYRQRGHLFTKTNPVRDRRDYNPKLELKSFELSDADLETVFQAGTQCGIGASSLKNIVAHLKKVYCQSIGVEYMYIRDPKERDWIQNYIHQNDNQAKFSLDQKKQILKKLNEAVAFESFLHTKYVGQKRFSLEGAEALIPALDALVEYGSTINIKEFVIGMAHRGRLNVLANIFKKPYKQVFKEFEGKGYEDEEFDGDVKYHLGYSYDVTTDAGKDVSMCLVPNPSHLETVGAVMQGISRAKINHKYEGDNSKLLPIIIHGDAAVAGQGLVFEIVQMAQLPAYKTGGSIHIVINNQVGFTTNYLDARSSVYCTDVAKTTLCPVLHVNGDDVEAVVHAMNFSAAYRQQYKKDVFIDLLCYRRYGHNEGDEPRFTQPKLYKAISKHKNVKDLYAAQLLEENTINSEYLQKVTTDFKELLETEFNESKKVKTSKVKEFMQSTWKGFERQQLTSMLQTENTTYPVDKLKHIAKVVSTVPENVQFVRKAERILQGRSKMVFDTNTLDWGMAENLAYGSLLEEGFNVRISGQDVERGTFSHRHAILRDEISEERINLLNNNPNNSGKMTIYNSLLSEYGVLGFDYGYAMANPNTLTIWEAQFGDFSNGAQIMFDQYISAAEDKWKMQNGIVVLLPHGYEGQGSEHSSARIERYLQLCAEDNMTVANCTTPANFYHLLRRQMKRNYRKPLIVFTPKSLLRHPKAVNSIEDLATGEFQEVIDDSLNPSKVTKLVFCMGKFYYDLLAEREFLEREDVALVRIEQLFPLHLEKIQRVIDRYPAVKEYVWAQEEPRNMGAWSFMLERLELVKLNVRSRKYYAVPAAGSSTRFKKRHKAVIDSVFNDAK